LLLLLLMPIAIIYNMFQGNISFRLITLAFDVARSDVEDSVAHEHGSSGDEDEDTADVDVVQDGISPKQNAPDAEAVSSSSAPAPEKSKSGNYIVCSWRLPL
jgi:hypothetical protein